MKQKMSRNHPQPPAVDALPLVNASADVARWLNHYWRKLNLPAPEAYRLAVTESRSEFAVWTGRRLNPMALGCYCYLPLGAGERGQIGCEDAAAPQAAAMSANLTAPALAPRRAQLALPGFDDLVAAEAADALLTPHEPRQPVANDYRHLIFVQPDLLPLGVEVTVAHELIHLSDRVHGNPRKHHCHGYDSISVDEAAITERDPEELRALLREETARREAQLRQARPYRYLYVCPQCGKEYPRVRRYTRPVSCGRCDQSYNPAFLLRLAEPEEAAETLALLATQPSAD